MTTETLTALIQKEGEVYTSLCPEMDIASQGSSIEEARDNLSEALALFFETADPAEIRTRLHRETLVTTVQVLLG